MVTFATKKILVGVMRNENLILSVCVHLQKGKSVQMRGKKQYKYEKKGFNDPNITTEIIITLYIFHFQIANLKVPFCIKKITILDMCSRKV